MRKKDFKGKCIKRQLSKCMEVCRTFDPIQYAYADELQNDPEIESFSTNVMLEGLDGENVYTSDFVCKKTNGDVMVRECVYRKKLLKPMTAKLLDLSREYWRDRGVSDWGIVIERGDQDANKLLEDKDNH